MCTRTIDEDSRKNLHPIPYRAGAKPTSSGVPINNRYSKGEIENAKQVNPKKKSGTQANIKSFPNFYS